MSGKYAIIIYWREANEAFIAEIPKLRKCMANEKTYQEALKNAEVIIEERIETAKDMGREIPQPQPKGKLVYA